MALIGEGSSRLHISAVDMIRAGRGASRLRISAFVHHRAASLVERQDNLLFSQARQSDIFLFVVRQRDDLWLMTDR